MGPARIAIQQAKPQMIAPVWCSASEGQGSHFWMKRTMLRDRSPNSFGA